MAGAGLSGGRNAGPVTAAIRWSEPVRPPYGRGRITGKRRVTGPRYSAEPCNAASPHPRPLPTTRFASMRARVRGQVLDSGGSGGLDAREFCAAIRKLVRRPGARAQRSCCGRLSLVIAVALFFAMGSGGERRKMRGKRAHSCTH